MLGMALLLSLIALSVLSTTREDLQLARNLVDSAKARQLAQSGISLAIMRLLDPAIAERPRGDGAPLLLALPDGRLSLEIQDEGGKIDVNAAPVQLLAGLFRRAGLDDGAAQDLAAALADWRSPGRLGAPPSPRDDSYRRGGLAYLPPHKPLQSVEELRNLLGMTPELYRRIRPYLTVYSRRIDVNVATAPRDVLLAVPGMTAQSVDRLIAARGTMQTSRAAAAGLGSASAGFLRLTDSAGLGSGPDYTVTVLARSAGGAEFRQSAVIEIAGTRERPYRILSWIDAASLQ